MPLDGVSLAQTYEKNGFVAPLDVLSSEEALEIRRKLEDWRASLTSEGRLIRFKSHLLLPWLSDLIRRKEILDAVSLCGLGDDILLWDCEWIIKEPHTQGVFAWHQDATYSDLSPPDQVVTAWLALSESNDESGAVRYIPSAEKVQLPHREVAGTQNLLLRGQEVSVSVEEEKAVAAVLRPGQMSLHSDFVLHASGSNRTEDSRIGLAMRFFSKRVACETKREVREGATLCRGKYVPTEGAFDLDEAPGVLMGPEELKRHREALLKMEANYMRGFAEGRPKDYTQSLQGEAVAVTA
uniref:Fe2OG dioxygenase domain-containing protein n=1 Tax=Chromera velia CCMP2878 TaxID=1169474 RepID=A0A0G4F3I0_9ALVE|eukprot:Cvel_14807.t1-p1 / transcript=Cvel_14807.t1 / gene=Cvel_14807 / organism=Chromera_velia_CCMP2878 / gene_product=hypothetical protein / transcript_product=hypothetical protein / location=Cvel_scaffold1068:33962-35138(+) / protein_length=295 / sequence_SO=supercontig / SO=protein_coding / is_pseudo=false